MNGYRLLLRLAPRRLRDKHGAEMEAVFRDRLSEARARGPIAAALAWLHAARDIVAAHPDDHRASAGAGADASACREKGDRS